MVRHLGIAGGDMAADCFIESVMREGPKRVGETFLAMLALFSTVLIQLLSLFLWAPRERDIITPMPTFLQLCKSVPIFVFYVLKQQSSANHQYKIHELLSLVF